jgi:hypothetical protein
MSAAKPLRMNLTAADITFLISISPKPLYPLVRQHRLSLFVLMEIARMSGAGGLLPGRVPALIHSV